MLSQENATKECLVCKSTNFYTEAGYYYCSRCNTQNEDAAERVYDQYFDATTRVRKQKIRSEKSEKEIVGWTSWELYNLVLLGMTNELIEIGADSSIKLTVLQLWTMYLTNLEVAFTSQTKKSIPKMARLYRKKDAEIIFGKIQRKKRSRKKGSSSNVSLVSSSFVSSGSNSKRDFNRSQKLMVADQNEQLKMQQSSDGDANSSFNQSLHSLQSSFSQSSSTAIRIRFNKRAKLEARKAKEKSKNVPHGKRTKFRQNYVSPKYATGPDVLTPTKLLSILYLALRIHNQKIYLSDMLRFGREGHLTYYKLDTLLPPEINLTKSDINFLTQTVDITHKGLRKIAARLAKFLDVNNLGKPDILGLIKRYCEDLELPRGILLYARRLFLSCPSKLDFTQKSSIVPNYEGRAMAYIIVVLKTLFGLDDITEKEISRVVEKINRVAVEKDILTAKLFSFCQWQQFIECRRNLLKNVHFPSKIKYDPECVGTSHLYLRFQGLLKSKRNIQPEVNSHNRVISETLASALYQCIDSLNDSTVQMKEMETFPPSLTPLRTYINHLAENSHHDVPYVLKTNFYEMKVGYITKPDSLVQLATDCGITLKIVDNSLHYLEKIVPAFEREKLLSVKELSELVNVESHKSSSCKENENLLDYSHRNRECKLKVDVNSFKYYIAIQHKPPEIDETLDFEEDSCFDRILPDGRLDIRQDSDSEHEDIKNESVVSKNNSINDTFTMDENFFKEQNIKLFQHELEFLKNTKSPSKKVRTLYRNAQGKFIKSTDRSIKKYKKIVHNVGDDSNEGKIQTPIRKKKKLKNVSCSDSDNEITEVPIDCFDTSDSDLSIVQDNVSIINGENFQNLKISDDEILFRPYRDYWMYHCNFSLVAGKNFELFEKELPENFSWLLNECANIIEMPAEDLYEEVCLIEAYHLNLCKSKKSKGNTEYIFHDCDSKLYSNNILNKW